MRELELGQIRKSNRNFIGAIALITVFMAFFTLFYVKVSKKDYDGVAAKETNIDSGVVAADEVTLFNDELEKKELGGTYIAGYYDYETLNNGIYEKINLIDDSFIVDDEARRIVNLLGVAAIRLDNNNNGIYYNIQPAIVDLYGGSKDIDLKSISQLYDFSEEELLKNEVVIDKTIFTIKDGNILVDNDLLPDGCKINAKEDGIIELIIPLYNQKITFKKKDFSIN
jgi:hypothetical protein